MKDETKELARIILNALSGRRTMGGSGVKFLHDVDHDKLVEFANRESVRRFPSYIILDGLKFERSPSGHLGMFLAGVSLCVRKEHIQQLREFLEEFE